MGCFLISFCLGNIILPVRNRLSGHIDFFSNALLSKSGSHPGVLQFFPNFHILFSPFGNIFAHSTFCVYQMAFTWRIFRVKIVLHCLFFSYIAENITGYFPAPAFSHVLSCTSKSAIRSHTPHCSANCPFFSCHSPSVLSYIVHIAPALKFPSYK